MSLTAFLPPSLLSGLSDVSVSPGSGQTGYPLVWDNTLGKWVATPLQISSLTGGPLPLAQGGTGTNNGSITGSGALNFVAGGSGNQNISITPSGAGQTRISGLSALNQGSSFLFNAQKNGAINPLRTYINQSGTQFWQICSTVDDSSIGLIGYATPGGFPGIVIWRSTDNFVTVIDRFQFVNRGTYFEIGFPAATTGNISIASNGNIGIGTTSPGSALHVGVATASTSTTTGAARIAGGLGVAGAIYVGGKVNFANLPTTDTGLAIGDLWRDGNTVKVKT